MTPMGQRIDPGETTYTRYAFREPEGTYGSHNPIPGADPTWAEAGKIGSGFFDGPEAIAAAMAAPVFAIDPGYQQAVREKIDRSIREKWLAPDLTALDPSLRFTR